jgi:hypothetical protein
MQSVDHQRLVCTAKIHVAALFQTFLFQTLRVSNQVEAVHAGIHLR